MPSYRCKHCGSSKVQGTLPVWHTMDGQPVDTDWEADFQYGYCVDCEQSGEFLDVVEQVDHPCNMEER